MKILFDQGTPAPVSYTHLDVYKRQVLVRRALVVGAGRPE